MSTEETIRQHVEDIATLFKAGLGKDASPAEAAVSDALVTSVGALLAQALVDLHAIAEAARATRSPPNQIVIHGS